LVVSAAWVSGAMRGLHQSLADGQGGCIDNGGGGGRDPGAPPGSQTCAGRTGCHLASPRPVLAIRLHDREFCSRRPESPGARIAVNFFGNYEEGSEYSFMDGDGKSESGLTESADEHYKLTRDEEREHIRLAVESLQKTLGARPLGWYCRYGPSVNTRALLAEEGGFLYDSDSYNDELPYWVLQDGKPQLIVPYSLVTNDSKFGRGVFATSDDYFTFLRDQFDMLYAEGATRPKMMSVGLHLRMIGHPARAVGLARFMDYILKHDRVWVARRTEIAGHWHKTFPYTAGMEQIARVGP
jgi:hypothetical protein